MFFPQRFSSQSAHQPEVIQLHPLCQQLPRFVPVRQRCPEVSCEGLSCHFQALAGRPPDQAHAISVHVPVVDGEDFGEFDKLLPRRNRGGRVFVFLFPFSRLLLERVGWALVEDFQLSRSHPLRQGDSRLFLVFRRPSIWLRCPVRRGSVLRPAQGGELRLVLHPFVDGEDEGEVADLFIRGLGGSSGRRFIRFHADNRSGVHSPGEFLSAGILATQRRPCILVLIHILDLLARREYFICPQSIFMKLRHSCQSLSTKRPGGSLHYRQGILLRNTIEWFGDKDYSILPE